MSGVRKAGIIMDMNQNPKTKQNPNVIPTPNMNPDMKFKRCKYCHCNISEQSKVCLFCKKKQKKSVGCLFAVIAAIVICAVIAVSRGWLKVGWRNKSIEVNGLRVSLTAKDLNYKVKDDEYDVYQPADGKKYVAASLKFKNIGDEDKLVSMYDFDCYADNAACRQIELPSENDFEITTLSAGRTVSFTVYFEVPEKASEIELEYDRIYSSDKKAIIKLK